MIQKSKIALTLSAAAAAFALAGCAQPGYNQGYNQAGYNQAGYTPGYAPPPPANTGYQTAPNTTMAPPGSVFYGRVESIQPIQSTSQSSGILGTVLGGAAGGLVGHQIGGGTGQTVATIGGAVLGAVAGNQVEKRVGSNTSTVYRVNVRLDDGRVATVTQSDANGLAIGARVQVANDRATPI